MNRQAAFGIFIGTNGTGKTSRMKELLDVNARNLIVPSSRDDVAWNGFPELKWSVSYEPDPFRPERKVASVMLPTLNTFAGSSLLHVDGNIQVFDAVLNRTKGFRNGGLFLDDFRNYVFTKGTLRSEVDGLFINRRHRMLDIFMACHGFEDVSRDLLRYGPTLFIFRTTLPPNDSSVAKMANGPEFLATVERVNERAKRNPFYFEQFVPSI